MEELTQNNSQRRRIHWKTVRKDMSADAIKWSFKLNREYTLSKDKFSATENDNYWALAIAIRDRLVERWIKTQQRYHRHNSKRVYYFSLEFLVGRMMDNYIINLGLEKQVEEAIKELGYDLEKIKEQESDAGLGNGGLGRLAACFLDSMSTLGIPAHGYGIRYDYGIFNQKIENGYQVEHPDEWLRLGNPWEFARKEYTVNVKFYGRVEMLPDENGNMREQWVDTQNVLAVPYDIPIPGYRNNDVNTLRLWSAKSTEDFDLEYFNTGDYEQAVYQKIYSENISKVLYPNDDVKEGRELRLKQEYFFTTASIYDIIRRFKNKNVDLHYLPRKVCIQLNDTHPALAIVELMRVLLDEHNMSWKTAWKITESTFAYTNHTLMPEALERWSVELFGNLLPRHLQIVYEINKRFLAKVAKHFPGDEDRLRRMSIVEDGQPQRIRMAHLAVVGSFSVNGVSKLHSELIKTRLLKDFFELSPEKFSNKTNGITQRRWLLKSNPKLSGLIEQKIGRQWTTRLEDLEKLSPLKDDAAFRANWGDVKIANKNLLANYIEKVNGIKVDPQSLFDVQIKRMHEYKRQLLFTFYIISEYLRLKNDPGRFIQPRTFVIGGKAAPGYFMAKLIVKLINNVAQVIHSDKNVQDKLKLVFLENYRVTLAEKILPASDLSEQISTAGMEASGTGNMKFMLNGALTIGTYDGANVEMADHLGLENIFIFGLKADEVQELKHNGYQPQTFIDKVPELKEILDLLRNDHFSPHEKGIFEPILESTVKHDPFLICADFDAYCRKQDEVSRMYQNREEWIKKSIINVSKAGYFSSDRTIREYARDIWKVPVTEGSSKDPAF